MANYIGKIRIPEIVKLYTSLFLLLLFGVAIGWFIKPDTIVTREVIKEITAKPEIKIQYRDTCISADSASIYRAVQFERRKKYKPKKVVAAKKDTVKIVEKILDSLDTVVYKYNDVYETGHLDQTLVVQGKILHRINNFTPTTPKLKVDKKEIKSEIVEPTIVETVKYLRQPKILASSSIAFPEFDYTIGLGYRTSTGVDFMIENSLQEFPKAQFRVTIPIISLKNYK